jgi:hypothetical protein
MRTSGKIEEFSTGIDLALPEGLAHRRAQDVSTLHPVVYLLLAQMAAIALYAALLQLH